MAEVRVVPQFNIYLTNDEFRLVGLSLAGRLTRPEDQAAARALNPRMLENRHAYLKNLYDASLGALTKATNEGTEEETTQ